MEYKIKAKIVSMTDGLQEYSNIRMIRIKSKHHTLLIMEDFMPVIGEIEGMVEIVFGEKAVQIPNIHGFYMHKKNEFNLLVKDGSAALLDIEEATNQENENEEAAK